MNAHDRLDEIEARLTPDALRLMTPRDRVLYEDAPALVAALRAVLDREALAAALFEFEGIGFEWSGPFAEGTYAPKSAVGRAYARADVIIAHAESALGGA